MKFSIGFFRKATPALALMMMFLIIACQPKLTPEEDCNFVMSSQVQRVSWKTQVPINIYITKGIPEDLKESIRVAASQWNYRVSSTLFVILEDQNIPNTPSKDGTNGIYWITDWSGSPQEQAKTTIYWKGDKIKEADIVINAKDYAFSPFGSLESSKVDMTSLIVHELGHVLGLQHVQGMDSVMEESLALAQMRQEPTENDLNSLKCEYKL